MTDVWSILLFFLSFLSQFQPLRELSSDNPSPLFLFIQETRPVELIQSALYPFFPTLTRLFDVVKNISVLSFVLPAVSALCRITNSQFSDARLLST
jgi:hypothetical protein